MLVKIGLALIALWLVGLLGLVDVGEAVHVLLLGGLLLLMMGTLKAREAAAARERASAPGKE
jgi:hypothetical protein